MQRIIKGDKVRVISGKNKGKEGTVLEINLKKQSAIVEGINMVKRHQKADKAKNQEKGQIATKEGLIPLCKLAIIDAKAKTGISKIKYIINNNVKQRTTRKGNLGLNKTIKK